MATFNEEDRKWLYDTMKSKGINTGSYDDFKQCLNNDEDRQWYYDKGKELGLNLGSKEDFDGMMWENNPVGKTDGHTETPETVKVEGNTFTESQLEAVENGAKVVQQSRYGTPEYANEVIKDDLPDNPYAGMTRQQAVNAIGEKYRKEWYGKPGAYENIKSELASYNIASPSDYGHITAAIRNNHLQSVARQRVEQLLSPFKNVNSMTFDDVQEVLDSRATQKAIDEDVRNLGLEQEDKDSYYQELEKQLEKVLTDKYGYLPSNDGRGSVSRYASSLINGGSGMHEERIREREAMSMIQGYLKDDIDATISDYDRQAQEVKESTLKSTGADYSVAGGSNAGMQLGSLLLAQREANKVSDPEKILKDLTERSKALFDKMLSDEAFISNVMKQSEALGIDPDQYVADYVIPSFMKSMQREFSKSMTARELPKGRLDYIMRGLTDDSIIGMLVQKFVMTDSQIQYRDMANAKYGEGANIWLQGARMATGMASDFWLWGGWGKLGGAATRSLLNQRIMALAASKHITREAATRIMEEEARQYLSKGLFEHIMRHVPQSAVTMGGAEATTEAVRGYTRNEEIGDVLLNTFKSGMSGAATGTAFGVTGGAASRLTSQLSGMKRLAGKLAGLEVEAATLYTTEELQKMLSGDDAFENPFEGMFEANVKLGFIKASANPLESASKFVNAVAHPVKTVKGMMEPDSKVLTEEDVTDLRETFDGKGLVDAVTTMRPVRHTDGSEREGYITEEKAAVAAQAYNDYMANPDRPIDRKQRVARLLGGIVPPAGKEVRIDIDTTDGKTVLRTRDAKGQCVQELYFDSHQESEDAANEMLYTIDQNTTTVLEDRISETAVYDLFRQKIDEEYQKVAAKYGDGVNPGVVVSSEMTETEKKWVYLHQHLDELLDITQAISDGRELGIDGQNLAEQFLGMFVEYSSSEAVASDNANRLRNAFEQQYGLRPGELDEIIRKGPGKRSDVESTILGEYQEFLRKRISDDDAAGKTDGHTEGTEGQAGGEAGAVNGTGGNEPPAGPATTDGETAGNTVIGEGQGEGQAIARSERRQAAYDRGKQAVQNPASLAAITYDSHLASLRLQQQFPENDPVLSRLRKDLMKAIVEGNDDEAERLMDLNAGNMNSRQKEAVEQYRDAMEMSRGVDDAVTEAVQAFQRQRHDELRRIAAADGTVTELTLADGSKAYYISGDLNNKYSGVIVANEQGETKQTAVSRIAAIGESVPMEAILRADVDAYGQQLQHDLSGFASGTSLISGSTVELGIGSYLVQVQYVGSDAAGNMVFKEADSRQSVFTPQDVQQFVQEANRMKMESQLRQEKTAAVEQARADRFGKGIVGYSEGKADVSHKDTDAKVAAEYLESSLSSGETAGHSALLKSIQGEIDKLNELTERSRETVSRMAAKQELQGLSEQEEIALGESQAAIDNVAGRRKKWGEIRQALMTDEERRKFESERQKEIKKAMDAVKDIPAGKPLDTLAVPTGKELLEQYEEQGDAENAVETLRANLKAQYRDDVYARLASVREAIEDYRRGLSDLTTDEINELAVSQKQLESQETAMMKQSQELKNLASSLGRLYAGRKKQQLSPHEYKMQQLEKETNKAKKLNLAKEAFADDEEALAVLNDLEPQDIYEHIADNLGEGSLSWEGFDRGEHHVRGVVDMVGKDKKRGIGKDSDTIGYNTFLAPTGQGKGYDEVVHAISEGSPYSTEDVANALYDMLSSASKPTDISHRIIDDRIARAEEIYETNREREREAEEDAKREALDQEIMQMTGMDPDEYDAYISDLESRLAEQEGYRSSEDYFNQTVERYEREQERNAGGNQETGALGLQGQEGEQGTGEGAAEEGAGGADAIAELQSDVNEFTGKYNSLPAEVISLDIPDAELIEKLGIPQYVIDHFGSEQKACEAVRNSLKEKKTVAAYNRESNKIIIFATAKRERIPEAMFHENVHGVLRGWYGDKEQSIATNFWNLSPDEGGKIDKSYIQKRYDEDEWKTEFFVTWLGRAMVDGTVEDMLKILSDPGDFERVNNILNAIGYDRAKETAERQGSGRLAEDNSSADGGRPEEGEVDAAGETDGHTEAQDFSARLAEAKSETNTNPTEEQKKAGNYKMGHISFGGYRMSIENPKGSTRSGKDANGKAWSIEMQDTYGYIGKKYGADGDHLDFFINDDADLDNWNGRVYVVDQGIPATDQAGKPLGTLEFDEHKVMYGYPSFKAAKEAYERNYEAGWWDKHVIGMTGVRKDAFDAWLNDSDHKRKPFAEYSRTRNAETITDNVDQLLADVRERAMKEIDELKNITTTYEYVELESRTIPELEQLKKKRTKDASTARYLMAATNIKAGSEKEHTLLLKEAEAKADIAAINEALKAKKDEMQTRIEQQEIGFAVTDRLNDMGYDVETDPKTVRRVRKQAEKDQSEEGKMRHMQTSDGTVYGFVYRGKMYIDIRKIDGNLPLHEYAHPWCEAFRKMNPEGWKAVVKTMQTDKDTWEFVKQLNPDLKTEDDIAEEMIAKGTGEKGEQYARAEYERMHGKDGEWKSKWNNIWKNIAKAIQDFWKQVGDYLHIKYESPEQVYDQVIRDFANNVNPKKKMEQWLKERDKSYLEAVKTGDEAKAKELFDAALRENIGSGIVPFVSTGGYRGKLQKLAHGVKSRDPEVIAEVADLMAPIIPKDAVLVPAPSHGGEATDMLDLANAISERTGAPVADVLKSKERGSQYDAKKAGKPLSTVDMGITIDGKLPEGKLPVVIDNVVDTGNTAEACVRALGKGIVASLADSKGRFKRVTTLKSAEPVVTDKKGNVVPLSKRFELPFQFMVEGNLFSDADFDEPETATEVALTGRRLNKYGLNEDTTIGKKLTEFLDKNDAPNLLAGYVDSKTGDYVILGESVNDIEEYADANQLKNAGDMDGMAYVRLTSKDFDILSPKLVKEGYKMAFVDDKTDKPTKPKDAVDTMLDEVDRRNEVAKKKAEEEADKAEAKKTIDAYLKERKEDSDELKARKLATKAELKVMKDAGVPYHLADEAAERKMLKLFSMFNEEAVKAFARRPSVRKSQPHGIGRYCVYNMEDPFGVPMYAEKLSVAEHILEFVKKSKGSWKILDIGWADETAEMPEELREAANFQAMMGWHGSGAMFDAFDHSHMGEGEGAQAYGWGTYVTEVEGIGKMYAEAIGDKPKIIVTHNVKEIDATNLRTSFDDVEKRVAKTLSLHNGYKGPSIASLENEIRLKEKQRDNLPEEEEYLDRSDFDKDINFLKECIESLKNDEWSYKYQGPQHFLYKVDIPEDTGDNYFDWTKPVPEERADKILAELRKRLLADEKYGWNGQEEKLDKQLEAMKRFFGEPFYWRIATMLGNSVAGAHKDGHRLTSELLSHFGYVGVKYPAEYRTGGRDDGAQNYVIFNEKDAKITDTIQFMVETPDTEAPVFFSNAMRAVEGIKQEKATPEQWLKMIEKAGGLKTGEDKWLNLTDWLNERKEKSLTKQEVMDFIRENQIEIEEVNYSENASSEGTADKAVFKFTNGMTKEAIALSKEKGIEVAEASEQLLNERYGDKWDEYLEVDSFGIIRAMEYTSSEEIAEALGIGYDGKAVKPIDSTRLSYTTEGLANKREIALVVPTVEPYNEDDDIHFGDAGRGRAVAWARFGETSSAMGRRGKELRSRQLLDEIERKYGTTNEESLPDDARSKAEEAHRLFREAILGEEEVPNDVLVIDEIQSKRHQEGREKGYRDPSLLEKSSKALKELIGYRQSMYDKYPELHDIAYLKNFATPEEVAKERELTLKANELDNLEFKNRDTVPDAPFDKNWHELAMKRMLRYAAENGYDKIAWTTGAQQAERYNIGGTVENIQSYIDDDETRRVIVNLKNGNYFVFNVDDEGKIVSTSGRTQGIVNVGNSLHEVVGKELALKILKGEGEVAQNKFVTDREVREISGDNLRIGGEGMKGFYDQMLPRFMEKYCKKWGVKPYMIDLPEIGQKMHVVDITPEMRESVMQGQPMFQTESNGILGWSDNTGVTLTRKGLNPNTPIHECNHLWDRWCMKEQPELWKKVVAAMKKTKMWEEIRRNPNYRSIWNDDDKMASEVKSRLSGIDAEEEFMRAAFKKGTVQSVINEVKSVLRKFWESILRLFGKQSRTVGSEWDNERAIVKMTLRDLLNKDFEKVLRVVESDPSMQAQAHIETDEAEIERLDNEPTEIGYRTVQLVDGKTMRSPMADKLGKKGEKKVRNSEFYFRSWERSDENPQLATDDGKIDLEDIQGVDYNPYIHIRPDAINTQFKAAWRKPELVYVRTLYPKSELTSGYKAEKAKLSVGRHPWSGGTELILSRWDKPIEVMPWEEVADVWEEKFKDSGVHFDIVSPHLLPILAERGVEILPPHKGMGKACQEAYERFKTEMEHKQKQLEIVTKANPMLDDYHTGIRKLDDIKTFEEAYLEGKENAEEGGYDEYASYPDITNDMIEEARKTGKITIYSSKPIKEGVFVTPSMMNAKDYAGNGKVYSKEVPIEDVAWINLEEGQYAKGGDAVKMQKAGDDVDVMPRLGTPRVEAANERFNDELDKQISGELPKGHVYQLGKPGAVLLSTGFPNDNIELSATHLLDKSKAAHHPFELSDVKDLVRAINTPLAVFSYGDRSKAQNVIAEIQKDGKNFVVGIHFNQNPRGMAVSDIRGLYPKDNAEWLNWITQGKLLYANKEKIQNLIDKQRRTLAEVDYLDLNSAAKVVKDFENPKLSDEKIREIFPDYTNAGDNAAEQLGGVKVIWEQQTLESGTKGWYDPNTNTVHVAIDEVEDVDDAVRTVYHEKLGHEGLVALFATVGKTDGHTAQDEVNKFGQFVFKSANAEIRKRILDKADEEGYEWTDPLRHSKAAQEVLSDIAADGPRTGDEFTLWEKVKHYIIRLLNKLNIRIPGLLNDHDLAYYIVKTGEALKRWNGMSETARENLASQSTRYDIMRSRGGKPRKRNDESYSQYLERLRAWEKWKIAKETAFANGDPIPDQKTFNDKWEEAYRRDMDAWRNENHIPDTEMPGTGRRTEQSVFPKREDGESVQEYAKRVAEYETQKDILKTAPNYFEYVQKAQDEYKKAYTEWRERYDLEEAENVDLKVYEGEGGDGPRTDADVEAEGRMERDLADAVGVEIDSDGAKRHAKLAVIERRKNLESSNAEDAIWLYDFIKMTDDFAGKLPGTVTGKMLREALPFIIEGTYWEEIVRDENGYPIGINDLSEQMPIKKSAELDELLAHVKEWYDEFYHLLEDAGLRNDAGYVENYVNHVWDKEKSDPKAWEKYVENYQRTKSPNMRHREIDTYQEGIDVGLVPKYKDIADMIAHYSRQNNEAIANKRFLEDLSGFVVDEVNSDGETVSVLPLLNSEKPDEFVRDRYSEYYVPGVGDVYVLKDVKKRFASIFGPLRTQDVADWLENAAKVYDLTSSTMKKIQLSISGFHALALSEVAVAQMRPDIAAKALVKYIILDSVRNKTIPAYAHPEDFMFAASHLVQLGATQDYAASDVNNITGKLRELMHELYESDGAVKKAAGAAGSVPAIMLDWVNKGMDKILWNYLHDGLKIACFKMFAEQIDERVKKEGLSEDLREKLLDEAGQYVNDTFGGQYFELLNITPATMKWLRRILLSPDWLISTQRHFFANFGFGSLYSDSSFKNYLKFNADNIKRAFGADIAHDELRRFRSKNAKQCYLLGVCFFFYTMWNALNAMFRYQDEKNEREKADEIRKENPDYRSPYELAYPDGMKWYDYTMLGNGLGQQTHLFLGRYEDGSEEYVRWGKQFREFPEMFIGRHGVEFPTPLIERMQGKSNPMVSLVRDNLGALGVWGFTNSKDIEEIQAKYGKAIGVLAMNARHFLPFSVPTQAEKEFKAIDLLMPSQKGFTRYKTVDFFKTYIQAGDMEGIAKTYQAAVMNNIDAESCLKAAISTLNATQRKEMSDGVTDLTLAVERFDKAESLNERRQMREKIRKYLSGNEYKLFTRDEAIQQVNEFLDGGDMEQMTVNSQRYLMLQTSEDVIEDWKVSRLKSKSKEYSDKIKKFRDEGDDARADALENTYAPWLDIKSEIGSYEYSLRQSKSELGEGNDGDVMKDIRQSRKELLHSIDSLRPTR